MNRIIAALERELEAKDAEIARLLNIMDHRDLEHEACRNKQRKAEQELFDLRLELGR